MYESQTIIHLLIQHHRYLTIFEPSTTTRILYTYFLYGGDDRVSEAWELGVGVEVEKVEDDGEGGGEGRLCGTVTLTQQTQSRETDLHGQEEQGM